MQESLKFLIAELHTAYFKPNGFKKHRQRFRRDVETVMQEVEFQSCSWNSSGGPITFYVNISVGFADIRFRNGNPALTGSGRIRQLVPDAPAQYDLTATSYHTILSDLLAFIPQALLELPKHYEDVRSRALAGWYTPIPLPDTWRA